MFSSLGGREEEELTETEEKLKERDNNVNSI